MGEVLHFQRSTDKKVRLRRPSRLLANLNGVLVELTELTLSGSGGGAIELLSYADIGVEAGDHADLRLPRPGVPGTAISHDSLEPLGSSAFSTPIPVQVVRCSPGTRSFGARFAGLTRSQVGLIEALIAPSRA